MVEPPHQQIERGVQLQVSLRNATPARLGVSPHRFHPRSRFDLDDSARRGTPASVFRGPTLVIGPAGYFMFASAIEYPDGARPDEDARDEYVMWGFSARRERLGLIQEVDTHDSEADPCASQATLVVLK
jgi:hypothetical protein